MQGFYEVFVALMTTVIDAGGILLAPVLLVACVGFMLIGRTPADQSAIRAKTTD